MLLTTQLAIVMPVAGAAAQLAYSAGSVAVLAYVMSLLGSFLLREPEHAQLPDWGFCAALVRAKENS